LVSASKGWNIPGLKCAQAVVASDAMRDLTRPLKTEQSFIVRAGNLGIIASIAAYRDSVGWLDDLVRVIDDRRALFGRLLRDALPGARHHPPQAGYLAWVDCRSLGIAGEPADVFRERGRVALGAGPDFGAPGKGFVRVTTATSAAILTEIVQRMRSSLR
jgi:cystathionine beta-lyase